MGEEVKVVYNVFHEQPLGVWIAMYFYLTGLSAGSFIISTMSYGFGIKKFRPLGKPGVVLAVVLLAIAPLNLIIDLGQPLRFWHLFPYLNFTSPITWGTFLLTLYPLNCVVYAWFMFNDNPKMTRMFGMIGIPLATAVHGYTGFILALGKARALWNTALMPFLFLVSAMVSGIALMILVTIIQGKFFSEDKKINTSLVMDLGKILAGVIVLDLFLIFSDILVLFTGDVEAREAGKLITSGDFAPWFLGVEILAGSLIPLIMISTPQSETYTLPLAGIMLALGGTLVALRFFPVSQSVIVMLAAGAPLLIQTLRTHHRPVAAVGIAALLVMIGIFAMRYVVVIGGLSVPLA